MPSDGRADTEIVRARAMASLEDVIVVNLLALHGEGAGDMVHPLFERVKMRL
jgi:hypothetical protein